MAPYNTYFGSPYERYQNWLSQQRLGTGITPSVSLAPELEVYYNEEARRYAQGEERRRYDEQLAQQERDRQSAEKSATGQTLGQLGTTAATLYALSDSSALSKAGKAGYGYIKDAVGNLYDKVTGQLVSQSPTTASVGTSYAPLAATAANYDTLAAAANLASTTGQMTPIAGTNLGLTSSGGVVNLGYTAPTTTTATTSSLSPTIGMVSKVVPIIAAGQLARSQWGGEGIAPEEKTFSQRFFSDPLHGPLAYGMTQALGEGNYFTGLATGLEKSVDQGLGTPISDIFHGQVSSGIKGFAKGLVESPKTLVKSITGTWICTEIKNNVGITEVEEKRLKIFRKYAIDNHSGYMIFYLNHGKELVDEIKAKTENYNEFLSSLKESFFNPIMEKLKDEKLEEAYTEYKDKCIKMFNEYLPELEVVEEPYVFLDKLETNKSIVTENVTDSLAKGQNNG